MMQQETSGQIGRKKKTPEELAAEARGEGGEGGGSGTLHVHVYIENLHGGNCDCLYTQRY